MKCPNRACGAEVEPGSLYCSDCATPIASPPPVKEASRSATGPSVAPQEQVLAPQPLRVREMHLAVAFLPALFASALLLKAIPALQSNGLVGILVVVVVWIAMSFGAAHVSRLFS